MDQAASSAQAAERSKAIDVVQTSIAQVGDTPSLTEHHLGKLEGEAEVRKVEFYFLIFDD